MLNLTRRQFVQAASLLVGSGSCHRLLAAGVPSTPSFAKEPIFEPTGLFLTWQRDPTTTMTIQWVGAEQDAASRPIWYSKEGSNAWQSRVAAARRFPLTDR